MPFEIIGYVPHTRQTETTGLAWADDFDLDYIEETARAHEEAGFDSVLVGQGSWGPDSWQIAAHVLRVTSRLKVIVAHRPGFVQPTVAARQAATLDRITGGGRLALHIISGGTGGELQRDGDTLPVDQRYARTAEYIDVLRRALTEKAPFDHKGRFYEIRQGFTAARPKRPIPISFAGSSQEALDIGARVADLYMIWGEPLQPTAETIASIREKAAPHGRAPRVSVSLRAIIGQSESEAWGRADALYERAAAEKEATSRTPDSLKQGAAKIDSVGAKRLDDIARAGDVADERLWLKYTRLVGRGGSTSALVGTVAQIVGSYLRYREIGATDIYLRGWNIRDDAAEYGRSLIPALREAVARSDATTSAEPASA